MILTLQYFCIPSTAMKFGQFTTCLSRWWIVQFSSLWTIVVVVASVYVYLPPDVRFCAHISGRHVVVRANAAQLGCKLDGHFLLGEAFPGSIWHPDHCQLERSYSHRFKSHPPKFPAGRTLQLQCTICILKTYLVKVFAKSRSHLAAVEEKLWRTTDVLEIVDY